VRSRSTMSPNAFASDSVVSSPAMKKMRSMYPMVPMGPIHRPTDRSERFHCPISSARSWPLRADHVAGEVAKGMRSLSDPPHRDRGVEQQRRSVTAPMRRPKQNSWWRVNTAGRLTCGTSTELYLASCSCTSTPIYAVSKHF
jgi:hypothetical protein